MNARPLFVFDANTLVSAALFKDSVPDLALRRALLEGELLSSVDTIAELSEVLNRPKFERYLTREERDLFLTKLIQRAKLIEVDIVVHACRDPADDKYLALAVAGGASMIVSGDADLRVLGSFQEIPIVSPSEYLAVPNT
jgi:putative PIN family toxin of toxin-antitoxin system